MNPENTNEANSMPQAPVTNPQPAYQPPQQPALDPQQPEPAAQVSEPTEPQQNLDPAAVQQPSTQEVSQDQDAKDSKKIKIIGSVLIGLGVLSIILELVNVFVLKIQPTNLVQYVLLGLEILLGIGILLRNKFAYYAFNVVAVLSILGCLIGLAGYSLLLAIGAALGGMSPIALILWLIPSALMIASLVFYVYGLVVLHPKRMRQHFK